MNYRGPRRTHSIRPSYLAIGVAIGILSVTSPSAVSASDRLRPERLPLVYGDAGAISQRGNDGWGSQRVGKWGIQRASYADGRLSFAVHIEPPATGLPGRSGPALLFARLTLLGGIGGDVGWEKQAAPIASVAMPPCPDESRCAYDGEITLPTSALSRTAALGPDLQSPTAYVCFTVVRTFGQGRWLQELPMSIDGGIYLESGTVGRPETTRGSVPSRGAFPAARAEPSTYPNQGIYDYASVVEAARAGLDDSSTALPTVSAQLGLTLHDCPGFTVAVHDVDGNLAFQTSVRGRVLGVSRSVEERIELLDTHQWSLTVHQGGIFETEYGHVLLGTFETSGQDLAVEGEATCRPAPSGSMSVEAATVPPETLPPTDTRLAAGSADRDSPSSALPAAFLGVLAAFLMLRSGGRLRRVS